MSLTSAAPRIFVSIAAYRDPDCQWTVRDLFEKAARPDQISVGICWQYRDGEDDDCFLHKTREHQCRVIHYNALESLGVCWARHQVQTLWQGEEYFFQIDSHMRFEPNWDETLLMMIANCPSQRPILSTYPPSYTPPDTRQRGWLSFMLAKDFSDTGVLNLHAQLVAQNEGPDYPVSSPFCSGGMLFMRAEAIIDVPYDPYLYFTGEEITLAARFWTHGWDIFAPNDCVLYHDYGSVRRRHWQDHQDGGLLNERATRRLRHLLRMEPCSDSAVLKEIDRYGLGSYRTLESFEEASGVNFRNRSIAPRPAGPPWPRHPPRSIATKPTPTPPDVAYAKANAVLQQKRYEDAAEFYALASQYPLYRAEAHYGRGIALDNLGRWAEAAQALEQAAQTQPKVAYLRLLAWVYYRKGDPVGMEAAARRAIALASDDGDAHLALALALINGGRGEGWQEYEWRWQRADLRPLFRYAEAEQWRGGETGGRHLVLWGEQGLGDEILFARYVPLVLAAHATVSVECDARLVPLLARSWPSARLIPRNQHSLPSPRLPSPPMPDLACPFGSLPAATGLGLEALASPFLKADLRRSASVRRRLKRANELLVAVSWRSATTAPPDLQTLRDWEPLFSLAGVRFVSVQAGATTAELAVAHGAIDTLPALDTTVDLDGVAAVLTACDLYIGCDGAMAHLASALGVTSWVLLAHRHPWHWPLTGESTPIYPTLRLLHQDGPEDGAAVLARAGQALAERIAKQPRTLPEAAAVATLEPDEQA